MSVSSSSSSEQYLLSVLINRISVNEASKKSYYFDLFPQTVVIVTYQHVFYPRLMLESAGTSSAWMKPFVCLLLTWLLIFIGGRKKETRRTGADHGRKQQKNWRSPEKAGNFINSSSEFLVTSFFFSLYVLHTPVQTHLVSHLIPFLLTLWKGVFSHSKEREWT